MASRGKQFKQLYEQTLQQLKNLKQKNDILNKSIGIQDERIILQRMNRQQYNHKQNINKIQSLFNKLQKTYLDPDTSRKINTIKQQYKIQKHRRDNIISSLKLKSQNQSHHNQYTGKQHQITPRLKQNQSQFYIHNHNHINNQSNYNTHNHINKLSNKLYTKQQQLHTDNQYDYQIQTKIIHENNRAIKQVQQKFINIYNITKQTQQIVYNQGEQLDIITDQLIKTNKNTVYTITQLKQANQQQQKSKTKLYKISIFVILAAIAAIIICVL